ncbi:hypothetical protein ST201phi2-1p384 [Pseudomonas phage 201phi2-1]|uniref:Uncharacterized protein n=1 Tax=Pseudomonas phage 201phi2-1 TaxID=198110 RepID=B3FJP4_BP201|nr:hypothetical protein ST201phi2-1p384 [Pseudomonas phage 201phi2-1]ABY63209.1 hypothetical protein 201phi2-1p384 [Pseudomonas phage 201phi2-1]
MRSSDEFKHFHRLIHAVDVLDAIKNEVMVWVDEHGRFQVDFSILGKPARARMRLEECDECSIDLYDELGQIDGKLIVDCDTAEEYTKLAERMISYLHLPRDTF